MYDNPYQSPQAQLTPDEARQLAEDATVWRLWALSATVLLLAIPMWPAFHEHYDFAPSLLCVAGAVAGFASGIVRSARRSADDVSQG